MLLDLLKHFLYSILDFFQYDKSKVVVQTSVIEKANTINICFKSKLNTNVEEVVAITLFHLIIL